MNLKLLILIGACIIYACGSKKTTSSNFDDEEYGYTANNPIKVGGGLKNGVQNEYRYLNRLSGPNGEKVGYYRKGSCCHFKSRNGINGIGLLDVYYVSYQNKSDTVKMYINMYDADKVAAPKGFKLN
jgi:hypothetical protein